MKNAYDEKYDIRRAYYEEIDEIMTFIDTYWKKGHILAVNRAFFEYEMVLDGKVNFIIAKDLSTGQIVGLHGFVVASKRDIDQDGWGSIWMVLPGTMGLLGLEIAKRMEKITQMHSILAIGTNPSTGVPHMKVLRKFEDYGKMNHFYCLSDKNDFKIAIINKPVAFNTNNKRQYEVININTFDEFSSLFDITKDKTAYPYKDDWYINHRYFQHPIYDYQIYGIKKEEKVQAVFVCRSEEYNNSAALRIVDYIGDISLFEGLSQFFEAKLRKYEYIDLYCYGVDTSYIKNAGMVERTVGDTNIIPNYFAPYVAENIDIWVGSLKGKAVFFKADGDQDRPSYYLERKE